MVQMISWVLNYMPYISVPQVCMKVKVFCLWFNLPCEEKKNLGLRYIFAELYSAIDFNCELVGLFLLPL